MGPTSIAALTVVTALALGALDRAMHSRRAHASFNPVVLVLWPWMVSIIAHAIVTYAVFTNGQIVDEWIPYCSTSVAYPMCDIGGL